MTPSAETALALDPLLPAAHAAMAWAHAYDRDWTRAEQQLAAQLFQRAIALDCGCAAAHAGLASAYVLCFIPYRGIAFEVANP